MNIPLLKQSYTTRKYTLATLLYLTSYINNKTRDLNTKQSTELENINVFTQRGLIPLKHIF